MRLGLTAGALCAAALVTVVAPANAAKGTYAGTVGTTTGKIALDVKVNKRGFVKKITELRGKSIPSTCEISGPVPSVNFTLPTELPVKSTNGKFQGSFTQPTYGNVSTIKGKIKHKNVTGTIQVNYHYQAEGQYPEENCDTGPLPFSARYGALDETAPTPAPRGIER